MRNFRIHLIRHGMTQGNLEGRYIGRTDLPLCPQGEEQLRQLVEQYEYPAVQKLYSSPLARCIQTAAILYPEQKAQPVAQLRECDFGIFEGKKIGEIKNDPSFLQWIEGKAEAAPPEGESGAHFLQRMTTALEMVLADMMKNQLTDVAVIGHSGGILSLMTSYGYPRRRMQDWVFGFGQGYSIRTSSQLWMRDQSFEIYDIIPQLPEQDDCVDPSESRDEKDGSEGL